MASVELVRARIEPDVKRDATAALAAMGLTVSDAIRMLLVRVATEKALPFDVRTPNAATRAALDAAEQGDVTKVDDFGGLLSDLNS